MGNEGKAKKGEEGGESEPRLVSVLTDKCEAVQLRARTCSAAVKRLFRRAEVPEFVAF